MIKLKHIKTGRVREGFYHHDVYAGGDADTFTYWNAEERKWEAAELDEFEPLFEPPV